MARSTGRNCLDLFEFLDLIFSAAMDPILIELNQVFCKVFRRKELVISPVSNAGSIDGWDSLTHMELITEIEKHFQLNFSFNEIMAFRNAGDIVACIEKHRTN